MSEIITKNDAFFAELLSPTAAKWSAGVAFDRSNGLPLDQWSVFQTEAQAIEYLSNAKAYPGQVIAYAEANGEMKVCVLSQNAEGTALTLKPVGIIPTGDGKTIEVSATGEITLKGSATATAGQQPRIVNKGTAEAPKLELEWYTPDNSTVAGLQETVGALKETVDGIIAEDGSVTKEGLTHKVNALEAEVGNPAGENTEATGLYSAIANALAEAKNYADTNDSDTTYSVAADEKALKLTGTEFSTELGISYNNNRISLTGINGVEIAGFDASAFIEDGFLQDVSYDATKRKLTFTWNIITGTDEEGNTIYKTDVVNIADLVDTYTAGNGLQLSDNEFSVKIDSGSESFLTVGSNGIKLAGVQEAINTAKQGAIDAAAEAAKKYDSKAEASAVYTKEEANNLLSAKANANEVYTKIETDNLLNAKANSAEVYTIEQADTKIADAVKPANDKLANIESGAQVNKLENLAVVEGSKLSVSTIVDKVITIDDSALRQAITEADTKAGNAATAASNAQGTADANALLIQANSSQIEALLEVDSRHSKRLGALEAHDATHTGEFNALVGRVSTAEGNITDLQTGKAAQADLLALQSRVGDNETAIAGLGNTKADKTALDAYALKTELEAEAKTAREAEKANADAIKAIYHKAEGADATGVLVKEIARVEGLISAEASRADEAEKANATAIENITKAETGAIAVAVAAEKARAEQAEKANADEIARVDNALKAAIENDGAGLDSIKELAAWIEEHGTEASDMAKAIEANAEAIADIYTPASGEGETAVPESGIIIDKIASVRSDFASADATTLQSAKDYSDANLATAKSYADGKVKELSDSIHGVDDDTIKLNDDNQVYVAKVSTDVLVQGTETLIFYAGTASEVI